MSEDTDGEEGSFAELLDGKPLTSEAENFLSVIDIDGKSFRFLVGNEIVESLYERSGTIDLPQLQGYVNYDYTAPNGKKTFDNVALANEISTQLKAQYPDDQNIQTLLALYEKLNTLIDIGSVHQPDWRHNQYKDFFCNQVPTALEELTAFFQGLSSNNLQLIKEKISKVRQEILKDETVKEKLIVVPRWYTPVYSREKDDHLRGDFILDKRTGTPKKIGCFVAILVNKSIMHFQIPFLLGLDNGWHILAASLENIERLKRILLKVEKDEDRCDHSPRLRWRALAAQTFSAAKAKAEAMQKQYEEFSSRKPTLPDEKAIKSHSCFLFTFDVFTEELDKMVCACKKEEEILNVIALFLQGLTAEQIGQMKMLVCGNVGDKAEGKTMGRDGDKGKPPGLGPFGGKPEPEEGNRTIEFKKLLPPILVEKIEKDPFSRLIFVGGLREWQNESGFELAFCYGEFTKIYKERNNVPHFDHLWLGRMKYPIDTGQTLPVKERREVNLNQKKFWISVSEILQMSISTKDRPNIKLPYFSLKRNLVNLIKRFSLKNPPGMKECEEQLQKLSQIRKR